MKASRLFAGYDHEQQVKRMASHFGVDVDYYKGVQFDPSLITRLVSLLPSGPVNGAVKTLMPGSLFAKRDLGSF